MLVWLSTGSTAAFINAITFLLSAITLAATVELGKRVFRRDLYLNGRTPLEGWMQEYSTIGAGWESIAALRNGLRLRFVVVFIYFVVAVEVGILALISPLGVQPAKERNIFASYRQAGTGLCLTAEFIDRDPAHLMSRTVGIVDKYVKAGGNLEQFSNTIGNDDESFPTFSDRALSPDFMNETMYPGELNLTVSIDEFGSRSYDIDFELLFGQNASPYGNGRSYVRPRAEQTRPLIAKSPIVVTFVDALLEGIALQRALQRTAFCHGEDITIPENDTTHSFSFACSVHSIELIASSNVMLVEVTADTIWRLSTQMDLELSEQNLRFLARAGIQTDLLANTLNDRERCGADELRYIVPTRLEPVTLGSIAAMLVSTCLVLVILFYYIVLTRKSVDWNSSNYRLINLISRRQERRGADCTELSGRSGAFAMVIQTNGPDYRAHLTVAEAQAAEDFGLARKKPRWLVADSSGYMES